MPYTDLPFASDLVLAYPEYHPIDMFRKVGGFHTSQEISEFVDALFQPGTILGSDASEEYMDQYRKAFVKNVSLYELRGVRIYGYNLKSCNYIKFALEKDISGTIIIDGSEVVKDYKTAPGIMSDYSFTELYSDESLLIGNGGILPPQSGQGIWLRQRIPKNVSDLASDEFLFGVIISEFVTDV